MKKDNVTLKSYFETGDYPTEAQFIDLIDSFLNIEEEDAVTSITDNLDGTYTFQLLSGGSVILDLGTLPDNIPIANIIGLQAALDAVDPDNFLSKDQDETTTGSLSINMDNFNGGKVFSVGAPGSSSYMSMDTNGWSIFGNNSANDGQDSHIIVKRNGGLDFNDKGTIYKIWHSGNDGQGSGLDADTLDGINSTSFVQINNPLNGSGTFTGSQQGKLYHLSNSSNDIGGSLPTQYGILWAFQGSTNSRGFTIYKPNSSTTDLYVGLANASGVPTYQKLWHSGNDGSGSGLDADLLRGTHWGNINTPISVSHSSDIMLTLKRTVTGNPGIRFETNESNNSRMYGHSGTYSFRFYSNTSNIANFLPTGEFDLSNLLTVRGQQIRLDGSTGGDRLIRIGINGTGNRRAYIDLIGDGTYSGYGMRLIRNNGGENTASDILHRGTGALRLFAQDAGTIQFLTSSAVRLTIASGGTATFSSTVTATNFILSSDIRLKTDISPIPPGPLQVDWKTFRLRESPEQLRYGVVAQELEKHHPEFVRTDEKGYRSVAYIDLLVAKNAELETRIEKLEKLIEYLI